MVGGRWAANSIVQYVLYHLVSKPWWCVRATGIRFLVRTAARLARRRRTRGPGPLCPLVVVRPRARFCTEVGTASSCVGGAAGVLHSWLRRAPAQCIAVAVWVLGQGLRAMVEPGWVLGRLGGFRLVPGADGTVNARWVGWCRVVCGVGA